MHRAVALLAAVSFVAGCAGGPARLPAPQENAIGVSLPDATEFVLAGGQSVTLVEDHEVPLIAFEARLQGGVLADTIAQPGCAAVLAELLGKGAGGRDARQFQADVDFVGGILGATASTRWIRVQGEFLTEHADLAIELLRDVLTAPRLDADEFAKVRERSIDRIRAARDEPVAVMSLYWNAWLFPGHPYGIAGTGDENSLARLTLADVRRMWSSVAQPQNVSLAVAGDFEPAAMRARLEAAFAVQPSASAAELPAVPTGTPRQDGAVLLVDKPDALQTYFRFGGTGVSWTHPDYPARYLANTVLGGRFTSRLNSALRIEAGLTYGAGSGFDDARGGSFDVHTYTATATSREAIELARDVYRRFQTQGLTAAELDSARSYVKGQYAPDELETGAQAATMLLDLAGYGLSRDHVDSFFERLDALELADVNRVIAEHFPAEPHSWLIVGRAEALRDLARELGEVTEIRVTDPGFGPR